MLGIKQWNNSKTEQEGAVYRKDRVEKTIMVLITETTTTTFIELGTMLCASCELTHLNLLIIFQVYSIMIILLLQLRNLVEAIVNCLPEFCFLSIHILIQLRYSPIPRTFQILLWILMLSPTLGEDLIGLMATPSLANDLFRNLRIIYLVYDTAWP